MTYHEVHHLSRQGFSIRWISNYLGLNWRTVKRLLSMGDDRQYERYLESCSEKDRILAPYEDFVRSSVYSDHVDPPFWDVDPPAKQAI